MTKAKKYDFRVKQVGTTWKTEITRRMTATKTIVSKSHDGFASEAEAEAWGKQELPAFLTTQAERNKRKTEKQLKAKSIADAIAAEALTDEADALSDDAKQIDAADSADVVED
ncbi:MULTISPECIES: DUF3622 domain-containing protein [unclassified Shewanella]|uniref:DUF3622 domain-containing protein n=1 Tax=unclassified Shewanella TaxID=196818 RepID=UPI000C817115|nr:MULTISPECIES: DUF3622 domain-containing protein [unclassified Shewanella]MDO6620376.1 DUF3622 domain-containing protein [Shewanella sp. 6_MG-2023]MDO6639707.1 DUF3622 domain-containing protein [Shewanella sp. 5_MG-2023]MDO6677666.1 DUF3622 domain-containing protein [Shewanella sp. 4_MG-2023]MDO6776826.1 DUF3622 domain-containing protein [Shewanella sp. 3_MG-2023]PMG29532.1 hypothetical protein BCU94_13170 [Shewanella sp. 10N.286.52.C2]